jgi:flagellum-specific peptidoglycan hydrolase FlgJ
MKKGYRVAMCLLLLTVVPPIIIGANTVEKSRNYSTDFTPELLMSKLDEMNFKYPYIVYAQAMLETGNFTSSTFLKQNNLFGMKRAKSRVTTAKAEPGLHASYESWYMSLIDYGLFQSRYLSKVVSEDDYYSYLSENYAEDTSYVGKLKKIVRTQNLKEKLTK